MSTDPREFEHPIDGAGGTVPPLVDVIAEVLAYEHCKRVNPKADHPIMGYHTFHPDQREHLRGVQMDVARAVLAAISEAGNVEVQFGLDFGDEVSQQDTLADVHDERDTILGWIGEDEVQASDYGPLAPVTRTVLTHVGPWAAVE